MKIDRQPRASLAWGPVHLPPSKEMDMDVVNRLTCKHRYQVIGGQLGTRIGVTPAKKE